MKPCKKCLENNWKFEFIDGWIKATCQNCENEIEFEATKKKQMLKEGALCRYCKTPIIFRESKFKAKKFKKAYYYTGYYWCQKCKKMYLSNKFKVINKTYPHLKKK